MRSRTVGVLVLLLTGLLADPSFSSASSSATAPRGSSPETAAASSAGVSKQIRFTRWSGSRWGTGRSARVRRSPAGLVIGAHPARTTYDDPYGKTGRRAFELGTWTSPWVRPGFGFHDLIASYRASTPVGTFITIAARARSLAGSTGSWDSLGRWAGHDAAFHRMSLGVQPDDVTKVAVDTLLARPGVRLGRWQLRLSLLRRAGSDKTPAVRFLGAVASTLPSSSPTSRPGRGRGLDLAVPRYSQEIHRGEYPRYNGGGEAWCSPTSTSMVMGFWHHLPSAHDYDWVDRSYRQPWVDHAARFTYAWGYDGTGDWPFNTAYAGRYRLDAFVTRLRSLREAELFIRAGIPLVASISFGPGELDGAPISSTSGHLVVIRGFTPRGRVIVNDPAAATARSVRRVYSRPQFENAWSDHGGVVYVIHPSSKPLPAPRSHANW